MRHKIPFILMSLFLSVVVLAQSGECPELVQQALETAQTECSSTGRNQVCYGHTALEAEGQPDAANFEFENLGDITDVAAVQRLQLAGLDVESGVWGVVLMQIQANIPDTLPGQNVTILLFGDAEIRNAASSVAQQIPPEMEQTI